MAAFPLAGTHAPLYGHEKSRGKKPPWGNTQALGGLVPSELLPPPPRWLLFLVISVFFPSSQKGHFLYPWVSFISLYLDAPT